MSLHDSEFLKHGLPLTEYELSKLDEVADSIDTGTLNLLDDLEDAVIDNDQSPDDNPLYYFDDLQRDWRVRYQYGNWPAVEAPVAGPVYYGNLGYHVIYGDTSLDNTLQ